MTGAVFISVKRGGVSKRYLMNNLPNNKNKKIKNQPMHRKETRAAQFEHLNATDI